MSAKLEAVAGPDWAKDTRFMSLTDLVDSHHKILSVIGGDGSLMSRESVAQFYARGCLERYGEAVEPGKKGRYSTMDSFRLAAYASVYRFGMDAKRSGLVSVFATDVWLPSFVDDGCRYTGAIKASDFIAVTANGDTSECHLLPDDEALWRLSKLSSIVLVNAFQLCGMVTLVTKELWASRRAEAERVEAELRRRSGLDAEEVGMRSGMRVLGSPLRLQFMAELEDGSSESLTVPLNPANVVGLACGVAAARGTGDGGGNTILPDKPGVYVRCDPPIFLAVGREKGSGAVKRIACQVSFEEARRLLEILRTAMVGDPVAETQLQATCLVGEQMAALGAAGAAASGGPVAAWVQ